ncbi:hypothetical protein NE848_05640 [Gramella jeungdoensis]|uniref:SUEL-type lectin domain-containing protein n=1 Tax=Gramella jeungdoensis TaxID=708091 RepID=A0ABT0YZE8_9FLAO|nr:LamG-like jellyroll fold domain-containing protein [Gramella jeungdoensis]MCM8568851.1 hypothetical protein [Gramella jeungdoensis]
MKQNYFLKFLTLLILGSLSSLSFGQSPIFSPGMNISPYGSIDSPVNEDYSKIIDGNIYTKFLDLNYSDGMGFTVYMGGDAYVATQIEITTANDFPNRDPRNFQILGSNNGSSFSTVATGNIPCVSSRYSKRTFSFSNTNAYTYYRINFTDQCGIDNSLQLAEVQLIGNKIQTNTPPKAICQNFTAQLGTDGTVTITPADVDGGSTDDKAGFTLAIDNNTFDCSNIGDNQVELTVTDSDGVTDKCIATVTVEDKEAPNAQVVGNIVVELDAGGSATITPAMINNGSSDNCTTVEDLTLSIDNTIFGCENIGDKGETINASALNFDGNDFVSIPDAPSLRLTGDMTIEAWFKADGFNADWVRIAGKGADGPRNYGLWYHPDGAFLFQQYGDGVEVGFHQTINTGEWYHIAGVKSGNVGKLYINGELVATNTGGTNPATSTDPLTIGYAGFHTYHIGQIDEVRLWSKARTDQEILNDHNRTLDPGTDGLLAYYNMEEAAGTDLIDLTGNGYDGSLQEFSQSTVWTQSTETLGPDNLVTLTVRDKSGNESTAKASVTVLDNTPPVVETKDITVALDETGNVSITSEMVTVNSSDNCTASSDLIMSLDKTVFSCENVGENNLTLRSEDSYGNISETSVIVTVEDTTAPTVLAQDVTVYLDENGQAVVTANQIDAGSTDNCGVDKVELGHLLYAEVPEFQNLTINLPAGKVVESVEFASYGLPTGSDGNYSIGDCHASDSKSIVEAYALGKNSFTIPADNSVFGDPCHNIVKRLYVAVRYFDSGKTFTCDNIGENPVVLKVTDKYGNTSTKTATVTVEDNEAPVLTPEADQDVVLDADCSITVPNLVDGSVANDNCTFTITQSPVAGTVISSEHNGTVDVIVTAADPAGNKDESTVVLTAKDNQAPVLTAEADQDVVIDADCSITIPDLVDGSVATDNCTATITQSPVAGTVISSEHNGTVDIVVTASDAAGNRDESTVVLTAIDDEAPVLTAEADQEVVLDTECSISVPNLVDGSVATDNCTVSITQSPAEGTVISSEHNGTVNVVVTATDAAGNTDESTVVLTAMDTEAPVLTAEADQEVVLDTECSISVPNLVDGSVATDNCSVSITQSPAAGTVIYSEHNGTVEVVVTATDAAGNTDETTVVLTAKDNESPVLTAEADQDVNLDEFCSITVPEVMGTATDNCTVTITQAPAAGTVVSSEHNGTVDVVVTATDAAGNTDESTVVLTAKDNEAPVLTAEADQDVDLDEFCAITVPNVMGTATDNCTVTITQSPSVGTVVSSEHNGTVDVVVTATDAAGNTDESTVVLTAKDNEAPELSAEADQDVNLDEFCSITVPNVMGAATDNCTVTITQSPSAGTVVSLEHNGTVDVVVTATDAAGNIAESTVVLTAKDKIAPAPVMENLAPIRAECIVEAADVAKPLAVDNCNESIEGVADLYFPVTRSGSTIITWKYDDGNGNVTHQQQEIIIEDTTAPVPDVVALEDIVVECGVSDIPAPTATDNCRGAITGTTSDALTYMDQGDYTITWTYDDENGNITTQQQNVIVRDVTAPEVSIRDITVYLDPETNVSITPEDIDNGSFDNCSEVRLSLDQTYFDEVGTYEVTLSVTDEAGNTGEATSMVTVEIDGVDAKAVHVVPTILKQSSMAKVVVPFRSKIMQVEVLETETNKYKVFEGNESFEMMINIAPFKGTLLVRVMDEDGTVHLKKLIAL